MSTGNTTPDDIDDVEQDTSVTETDRSNDGPRAMKPPSREALARGYRDSSGRKWTLPGR